jgi:hypothetical protein
MVATGMSQAESPLETSPEPNPQRWWTPRIWFGCEFPGLVRLLIRNRFDVSRSRVHAVVIDLLASVINSGLGVVQDMWFSRRIARIEVSEPPVFIIGHWRSGTTLLHELLIRDERHTCPNYYQCLVPRHFLITERIGMRLFGFMMPSQRAMDSMPLGFERPQEEEFALCNLGVPSPYLTLAFPNRPTQHPEYFTLEDVDAESRELWKRTYLQFLKQVTYREPKRLVLKSPINTFRIRLLLELFPDARFVHIVRDPHDVFPSTVHLWKSLFRRQAFQVSDDEGLDEFVFETYSRMDEQWDRTRHLIAPERLYEIGFEKLVDDPLGEMERLYDALGLGEFERARPRIEEHLQSIKGYATNRYHVEPKLRAEIASRWGEQILKYDY